MLEGERAKTSSLVGRGRNIGISMQLYFMRHSRNGTLAFSSALRPTTGLGKRADPRLRESPPAVGASSRNLGPTPVVLYCLTAVLPSEMDEGMTDRLPDRLPGTDFEGDTREQRVYISRAEDKRSMDGS